MMHRLTRFISAFCIIVLTGCAASKPAFHPDTKFPRKSLEKDYQLFRNILEENHPSLYWYTSKDSMDYYFNTGFSSISDSMTENEFRTLLSYVISKVNCGHTTVRPSKKYLGYYDTVRTKQFPLYLKFWDDTAVIVANLHRGDTSFKRGTVITSINDLPLTYYRDTLFQYLSMDGYGITHKYQSLSNRGNFGGWYKNVFGLQNRFKIGYLTDSGEGKTLWVPVYDPKKDTVLRRRPPSPPTRFTRKERRDIRLFNNRNMQIDTTGSTAYMTVNTFTGGNGLRRFFKSSFKALKKHHIQHLVVDVRNNGGGNVGNSTVLTEYLINKRFKLADSLYAINRKSHYGKYIKNHLQNRLFMSFISRRRSDGYYHFGYFERHYFKPKKKNHYNGNVYVITGGNSFSATTVFANSIRAQDNVIIVGEETGGAAYGNTAWLIPDVRLPNTKLRFRLPKFRMVMNKDYPKDGRGVIPDVVVKPSVRTIRDGIDPKVEKVKELIKTNTLKQSKLSVRKDFH